MDHPLLLKLSELNEDTRRTLAVTSFISLLLALVWMSKKSNEKGKEEEKEREANEGATQEGEGATKGGEEETKEGEGETKEGEGATKGGEEGRGETIEDTTSQLENLPKPSRKLKPRSRVARFRSSSTVTMSPMASRSTRSRSGTLRSVSPSPLATSAEETQTAAAASASLKSMVSLMTEKRHASEEGLSPSGHASMASSGQKFGLPRSKKSSYIFAKKRLSPRSASPSCRSSTSSTNHSVPYFQVSAHSSALSLGEIRKAISEFGTALSHESILGQRFTAVFPAEEEQRADSILVIKLDKHVEVSNATQDSIEALIETHHPFFLGLRQVILQKEANGESYIVYDLPPKSKPLSFFLDHRHKSRSSSIIFPLSSSLSTSTRLNIMVDITCAINFLHSEGSVHGCLTADNIFITKDDCVKVSEWTLSEAKLIEHPDYLKRASTLNVLGYSCPVLTRTGTHQEENDIYSLGLLMLQLLTGREPVESGSLDLVSVVENHLEAQDGDCADLLDKSGGFWDEVTAKKLFKLAMRCSSHRTVSRPSAASVLSRLRSIQSSSLPSATEDTLDSLSGEESTFVSDMLTVLSRGTNPEVFETTSKFFEAYASKVDSLNDDEEWENEALCKLLVERMRRSATSAMCAAGLISSAFLLALVPSNITAMVSAGAIDQTVILLAEHAADIAVQDFGCRFLSIMIHNNPENKYRCVASGALETCSCTIANFGIVHANVAVSVLRLLAFLADSSFDHETRRIMVNLDFPETILKVMAAHENDEDVQDSACIAIMNLVTPDNAKRFVYGGAMERLAGTMKRFISNYSVIHHCLQAMHNLCQDQEGETKHHQLVLSIGGLDLAIDLLQTGLSDSDFPLCVLEDSCDLIFCVLSEIPSLVEESSERLVPLIQELLGELPDFCPSALSLCALLNCNEEEDVEEVEEVEEVELEEEEEGEVREGDLQHGSPV